MNKELDFSDDSSQHEAGLSFQEKSLIVSAIGSLLIYVIYGWLVLQRYQAGNYDEAGTLEFWGRAILLLIVIQVVFEVIMTIALVIVNAIVTREEEDPSFADERDKLIDLKGTAYQFAVFGTGFFLAMGAMALGQPPVVMFVVFMTAIMAAGVIGSAAKLYLYRRGV